MDQFEALSHVDHTILKAVSTTREVEQLCREALAYHTASVCIPPSFVKYAHDTFGKELNVCTVIGFPLGYNTTAVKVFETKDAIENGATEVDMVVNLGWVKEGRFDLVTEEIRAIKAAAGSVLLKVIVETCYLTDEEIVALSKCVTEAKAEYIKTSTGFGTGGATVEAIKLMKANIGPDVKMKASGGIRTKEEIETYLALGVERIGASSAIKAYIGQ